MNPVAHPKQLSQASQLSFQEIVPAAVPVAGEEALFDVFVDGVGGRVRVKRAVSTANQIQVSRGEPIALHVPDDEGGDEWFVLPVSWQLRYAREHPGAAQHASHAFDCMAIPVSALPRELRVAPEDLAEACAQEAAIAAMPMNRAVVKAIRRTRDAVADVLIDTLGEVIDNSDD